MSIQSEINRLKQNVSAAFTAIGNKGGTVPNSKVSGNLVNAINSIPVGVTVQTSPTNASFTTDADGRATVNCGFKPDLVVMFVTEPNENGDYYHPVFGFTALSAETVVQCSEAAEYFMYVQATRTSNGFILDRANKFSFDWEYIGSPAQSFRYVAVKYT
jgi:hypothetical protein